MVEDKLYHIALQCARFNDNGCDRVCEGCQFNIYNYVYDVREASLLKAVAYTDYLHEKQIENDYVEYKKAYRKESRILYTIFGIAMAVIILFSLRFCCVI